MDRDTAVSDMGMKQRQLSAGSKKITEIGLQRKE